MIAAIHYRFWDSLEIQLFGGHLKIFFLQCIASLVSIYILLEYFNWWCWLHHF